MPSRELPSRPDLDHLKREARSLQQAARNGDPDALQRLRQALGIDSALKLTDAQRAIAREYGFPTWARLRSHVQASRGADDAINTFLFAVQAQDQDRAREVLRTAPRHCKGEPARRGGTWECRRRRPVDRRRPVSRQAEGRRPGR